MLLGAGADSTETGTESGASLAYAVATVARKNAKEKAETFAKIEVLLTVFGRRIASVLIVLR